MLFSKLGILQRINGSLAFFATLPICRILKADIACEGLKHYEVCDVSRPLEFIAMS